MEQTKGYLRLKGKIWGLNNTEPKSNKTGSIRSLSFRINTSKENSLFLQVGKWANTNLNVKVKAEDMEEVKEINEQEAIEFIKANFKDGDSVFINARADVNKFSNRVDYLVNQIYIENEPIDFNSEDFEETNELNTPVVITEKANNGKVKGGVVDYTGKMVELELSLSDEDVNNYFSTKVKVGDLLRLSIEPLNIPIFEDVESGEVSETRTTLKGRKIGGGNKKRNITGYDNRLEVVDVDIEKSEKEKYSRQEIREALAEEERGTNNTVKNTTTAETIEDDDDLPF